MPVFAFFVLGYRAQTVCGISNLWQIMAVTLQRVDQLGRLAG